MSASKVLVAGAGLLACVCACVCLHAAAPPSMPLRIEDALAMHDFQVQGVTAALSPDGQWVVTTVCDSGKVAVKEGDDGNISTKGAAYRSMGCDLWLYSTRDDKRRNLTAGGGNNWSPSWSPDGKSLAFYSDRDGQPNLWVWQRDADSFRKVGAMPTRHFLAFEIPLWTPDGSGLIAKLRPEGADELAAPDPYTAAQQADVEKEPGSTVAVFMSPRPAPEAAARADKQKPPAAANAHATDIGLVDFRSGETKRLVREANTFSYRLSPDGRYLGYLEQKPGSVDGKATFVLVELSTARARTLMDDVAQSFAGAWSWSPDSRSIAVVSVDTEKRKQALAATAANTMSQGGGDLYLLALDGSDPRRVSGAPGNQFSCDYLAPLWDARGERIYLTDVDGQVWKVDAAAGKSVQLTRGSERKHSIILASAAGNTVAPAEDARYLYTSTRNRTNRRGGFSRIDTNTGDALVLSEEDKLIANIFSPPVMSPDGRQIVYLSESSYESADLWMADAALRKPRRLTAINPQLDKYAFGRSRTIDFTSSDGKPLHATVVLPADYTPGKRYPMMLWVYASIGDASRSANTFGLVGMQAFNMHMLTTRGYAVMWPDIPTGEGTPMKDLMKAVMPAIDRAVELGIADPDRLAVMGNSNGGYSTLALVTQTTRFKAAIMNSGFGDLTAFYGTMGGGWIPWLERLGGGMRVPPWEDPMRYVENSPIYYLDRIETPLLIQAGAADLGIIQHSDEVWVGMQRLNKKATYLRYGGESHVLAAAANLKDYWKRVLAFLDDNLQLTAVPGL